MKLIPSNVLVHPHSLLCDKTMFDTFYYILLKRYLQLYYSYINSNIYLQITKINSESNYILHIPNISFLDMK